MSAEWKNGVRTFLCVSWEEVQVPFARLSISHGIEPCPGSPTLEGCANRLALDLGVPSGRITDILTVGAGSPPIRRCALAGISATAQFWLDLQRRYAIAVIAGERGEEIARRVRPADAA